MTVLHSLVNQASQIIPHPARIYVVIPTLNEEKSIGQVLGRCKTALKDFTYEIIVVDGSKDNTRDIARGLGATVLEEKIRGYGAAYLTGFAYILDKKDDHSVIVMIDGDLTYAPEEIPALIAPILEGRAEMVLANRFTHMTADAMSIGNRLGNRVISRVVAALYGLSIQDSQTGLRAVSASCLREMFLEANGMPLATEMLIEAKKIGANVVELPATYSKRVGKSKIRPFHDGYGIIWTTIRLASELKPFVVYGGISLLFLLAGVILGSYTFVGWYQWQFFGLNTWPRLGSALLSVMFLVTSTIVFVLGILLDTLLRALRATTYRQRLPPRPQFERYYERIVESNLNT
jgi:glycosyltransferase involved in cell wall biosynthesis